uniref:Uncharacterized protein n=1 Tax=Sinorhizobium medicae TaxID=110321 RepID=D1CT57_9HYPH|nr:hypothetical protein [Sinorhizobium medicae]
MTLASIIRADFVKELAHPAHDIEVEVKGDDGKPQTKSVVKPEQINEGVRIDGLADGATLREPGKYRVSDDGLRSTYCGHCSGAAVRNLQEHVVGRRDCCPEIGEARPCRTARPY